MLNDAGPLESIIVIPPHGIQFETHRGFPPYPLFASRSFIPLIILQNFVINEGLRRWDVRFYLAAIKKASSGAMSMEVAYEVNCRMIFILVHAAQLVLGFSSEHSAPFSCFDRSIPRYTWQSSDNE